MCIYWPLLNVHHPNYNSVTVTVIARRWVCRGDSSVYIYRLLLYVYIYIYIILYIYILAIPVLR